MSRRRRLVEALLLQVSAVSATLGTVIWALTLKYGNLARVQAPAAFTWRWALTAVWAAALAAYVLLPAEKRRDPSPQDGGEAG